MYILSCLPRTVFKRGKIEIDYFDKYRCLHLSWSGNIEREEYISVMGEMYHFTKKLNAEFWVLDAREEDSIRLFDPQWSYTFFAEEVSKLPVKKIARIASGYWHHETRVSEFVSELIRERQLSFGFKYLPDLNHAIGWFMEEEHPG